MNTLAIRRVGFTVPAAVAALLLALGACAANRQESGGIAPSRKAGQSLDDSNYYAPSGSGRPPVTDTAQKPLGGGKPMQAAAAPTHPGQPEEVRVAMEDPARGRKAAPLVPAFPARMEQPRVRDMKTIHFDFDAAELSPGAKRLLDANAAWLKANPSARVRIEGHCDERGTSEYNLALGSRRAGKARDYLLRQGVVASAVVVVSYGAEMPLKAGHDEAAWRWNRRVEFSPVEAERSAVRSAPAIQPGS